MTFFIWMMTNILLAISRDAEGGRETPTGPTTMYVIILQRLLYHAIISRYYSLCV
jgi:hypothetical protein